MAAVHKLSSLIPTMPSWRQVAGRDAMPAAFARMAEATGAPPAHLMADFAALAFGGPGRISFADYERLRLYDADFWGAADRREAAGAAQVRRIARIANFRRECWGLASDRLASSAYLAAHGLPTVPTLAIYRAGLAAPGASLLRTRDELRQFLQEHADAPLIARPSEGGPGRRLFAGVVDPAAEIDRFIDAVSDAGPVSWLFQAPLEPHPVLADARRIAPVRLITLAVGDAPLIVRGAWLFGGSDEFVASLDLRSGAAVRVAPALAPQRAEPAPADLRVPDWPALKAVAAEGARLFAQFGLIGWDIAPTAGGPVILGLDPAPDLDLHQLADRRGVLEPEFLAFLADRRALAAERR